MKMGISFFWGRVPVDEYKRGIKTMGIEKRFRYRLVQILLTTVMLLPDCPLTAATNVKLSGTMPAFGDIGVIYEEVYDGFITKVHDFQISPDGKYVVYRADQDTDRVFELYSVSLTGGSPIRLNPLLPVGRSVQSFQISPDSSRVVYRADQDADEVTELYSVPIEGPAALGIKLNGVMAEGGDVRSFQISPDSSRVVYWADQQTDEVYELFTVPITGPPAAGIKINKISLAGLWTVRSFQISRDSSRVVYIIKWVTSGTSELYSVPIGGPAASGIKLNGILADGGNVTSFQISANSGRVVYTADQETVGVTELYSVPIGGPAASGIKLNGILADGGNVGSFQISPDSSRVVYRADQQTDGVKELYSVPINGLAASGIKLNGILAVGGNVLSFQISADSGQVVYTADQEPFGGMELYSVPIGGPAGSGIKLSDALREGLVPFFMISPDGRRVFFTDDQDTVGVYELYGVLIEGPAASRIKLNGDLTAGGRVLDTFYEFQISPDNGRVFYVADQDTDGVVELYMTSFDDTPDPFSFTNLIGVPLNTAIISNTIAISGINTGAPISISGGEYAINGGLFTSSIGTVNNGDTVTVRLTSSSSISTTTEATLTIGGISNTFSVTTMGLINLFLPLILR
jgi:Tol biopolymer transport system component